MRTKPIQVAATYVVLDHPITLQTAFEQRDPATGMFTVLLKANDDDLWDGADSEGVLPYGGWNYEALSRMIIDPSHCPPGVRSEQFAAVEKYQTLVVCPDGDSIVRVSIDILATLRAVSFALNHDLSQHGLTAQQVKDAEDLTREPRQERDTADGRVRDFVNTRMGVHFASLN